jgi:6-phosphogluconolactonase (cycloisomerase 2 family)
MALSPDGSQLVVAAELDGQISVLESGTLVPIDALKMPLNDVTALAMSPSGTTLLAGHDAVTAFTRDLETGALSQTHTLSGKWQKRRGEKKVDPFAGIRDLLFVSDTVALSASPGGVAVLNFCGGQICFTGAVDQAPIEGTAGAVTLRAVGARVWAAGGDTVLQLQESGGQWSVAQSHQINGVQDIAISADGKHLYVAGDGGLRAWTVADGALTAMDAVTLPAPHGITHGYSDEEPAQTQAVTLAAGGAIVAASSFYGGYVLLWDRDTSTGALSNGRVSDYQPASADDRLDVEGAGDKRAIGFDPATDSRLARFVSDAAGDTVFVVSGLWSALGALQADGGELKTVARRQQGDGGIINLGGAYAVAHSPDGKHVYVGAANAPHPGAWARDAVTGALTPLAEPSNTGISPIDYGMPDVTVTADGAQVLAIDDEFNRVHAYDRDAETGALSFVMNTSAENSFDLLISLTVSPDGKSVYVADFYGNQVGHITRDAAGQLSLGELYRDGEGVQNMGGPEAVLVAPDNRFAYAVTYVGAALLVFNRDTGSGALTQTQVLHPTEGDEELFFGMEDAAFNSDASRVILVSPVSDRIAVCSRDAASGEVALLWQAPFHADEQPDPGRVVVAPDNKSVHVSLRKWGAVASFDLNADGSLNWTGTWSPPEQLKGKTDFLNGLTLPADGKHLYSVSMLGDSLTVFQRNTAKAGSNNGCGESCP